jgi:YD repeat-containing protein
MVDPLGATTYGYDALNRALAVTSRADKRRRRARVDGDLIEV